MNNSAMVVAAMLPGICEARISRTSHQRAVMASDLDDRDELPAEHDAGREMSGATPRAAEPDHV